VYRLPDEASPLLSVIIPVYNERATLGETLREVEAVPVDKELIIVDDGSTDGTRAILGTLPVGPRLRVLLQDRNRGKGAALRRGFEIARGAIVIVQDADLEYQPADYPALLAPILRGHADVVFGARAMRDRAMRLSVRQYLGNRLLTMLVNIFTRIGLEDVYVGYKVFRRSVLERMRLREDRFGFEIEVTAAVARGGWRISQVPIVYHPRSYQDGKKITWRDALHGVWCVVRYCALPLPAAIRRAPAHEEPAPASSGGDS
jgi:glycosyltransferase involved in cell wall biosynthesis